MSRTLDPNIPFPTGRTNLNASILGKTLSFASVVDEPMIPGDLKAQYAAEMENVKDAERNMITNEGNPRAVRMYRTLRNESLEALNDIQRRILNARLDVNWV